MNDLPSVRELRSITQPDNVVNRPNAEHWMGRLYLRALSPYVTRIAIRSGLSANSVTALMILTGLIGVWSFALSGPLAYIGVAGVQIYLLLDCVDGEVARFRRTQSAKGIYLDRWGHYVVETSLFIALGIRAFNGDEVKYVVIGLLAALFAALTKVETDLVDSARLNSDLGIMPHSATAMENKTLATGRNIIRFFPFHRLAHAAEASLAVAVAITIDLVRNDLAASRLTVLVLAVILAVVMPLHLISVLLSTRLTSQS